MSSHIFVRHAEARGVRVFFRSVENSDAFPSPPPDESTRHGDPVGGDENGRARAIQSLTSAMSLVIHLISVGRQCCRECPTSGRVETERSRTSAGSGSRDRHVTLVSYSHPQPDVPGHIYNRIYRESSLTGGPPPVRVPLRPVLWAPPPGSTLVHIQMTLRSILRPRWRMPRPQKHASSSCSRILYFDQDLITHITHDTLS